MNKRDDLQKKITALSGGVTVLTDEPMGSHTSFGAGGRADFYITVQSPDELRRTVLLFSEADVPYFIIGNGTNVLVSDAGYHGAVITYRGEEAERITLTRDRRIVAGSAARLEAVAQCAERAALSGFEGLSGIPGLIGGALSMNAGAYGTEMKDVVFSVTAVDLSKQDYPEICLTNEAMLFGYRTSVAKKKPLFFTSAVFLLTEGDRTQIANRREELNRARREKQPLSFRSAGSTFKRPEGHFAGKLIEEAGLKGTAIGQAQVSEKHAGFIVNRGGASATDIIALMRRVRDEVEKHSGIVLEPEVILLGEEL